MGASRNLNNAITKTGEQTTRMRDMQNLIQALSSNGYENMQSLAGQLSGRAWGEMLCKEMTRSKINDRIALLKTRGQYKQAFIQQIEQNIAEEQSLNDKAKLLSKRLDALQTNFGVTDPTANHNKQGIPYCRENKETGKCNPIDNVFRTTRLDNDLEQEIQTLTQDLSKAPNKDAQSQAYANFNQRIKLLTVKYLKEITNQMLFLNQTMAIQSEIIADMYQTDYGFGTNLKGTKSTQYQTREQILGKVKTNKFGFPKITSD